MDNFLKETEEACIIAVMLCKSIPPQKITSQSKSRLEYSLIRTVTRRAFVTYCNAIEDIYLRKRTCGGNDFSAVAGCTRHPQV